MKKTTSSITDIFLFLLTFTCGLMSDIEVKNALQDDLSGYSKDYLDLLIGTVQSKHELRRCSGPDKLTTAQHENCISRYFVASISGIERIKSSKCVTVNVTTMSRDFAPEVCFDLKKSFWYGGSELQYQRWPFQNTILPMQPFVTNDIVPLNHNQSYGNVLSRYWISSKGLAISIDKAVRLSVSFNHTADKLCVRTDERLSNGFSNAYRAVERAFIKYSVCQSESVVDAYKLLAVPVSGVPDTRMIKSPIWSTWAKYKVDIDESKVLQYADEIVKHGFSNSQLEIDDMFSTRYGEFDFSPVKFKDPQGMIKILHDKGFRVTVWITPFANLDSPVFTEGMDRGFWLKDLSGQVPALVRWWQGVGGTLDVANPEAVDWFVGRLKRMMEEYGVDSFKFDAGEVTYLPSVHEYTSNWTDPTEYTAKYVEAASRLGSMIEVRCGYNTQHYPLFVRMGDKESRWGFDNGLRSLIPTVLTMGILGYPYVLPDMIGGNGYVYSEDIDNPYNEIQLPDRELYIRWLELTAYLPAMQFSFVPWQYDTEVVDITRKYVKIHEEVVTPLILEAAEEAQKSGSSLIRPLWWIAPHDMAALECETQFLVGDRLLVAPIVEEGARARDIYLPEGLWEDQRNGQTLVGTRWINNYPAALDEVPTFLLRIDPK